MGSWRYIYLFPRLGEALRVDDLVLSLLNSGFSLDPKVMPVHDYDGEHCEASGSEIEVENRSELVDRLQEGQDLLIQLNRKDIYLTIMSAGCAASPHAVACWPNRSFNTLAASQEEAFWLLISTSAERAGAEVLVSLDDPPDHLEDRFLRIDGNWFAELLLPSGRENPIDEIWFSDSSPRKKVGGLVLEEFGSTPEYIRFRVRRDLD